MKKTGWALISMLFIMQVQAQVTSRNDIPDKTAKLSFRSVYETNQYYNELEESIELKYANLKVPVFEQMEGPQDSLWMVDEQISTLRDLIRQEELNFISWEKNADRNATGYQKERLEKQEFAKNEIIRMQKQVDDLESTKPAFVRSLKEQELQLEKIDRLKEKDLDRARLERQAALVKMYRA